MTSTANFRGVEARTRRAGQGAVLAVLLTATFMAQFDFFVVNVAAPSIRHDLHAGASGLELIVGGYAFAYATGLVLGGRLGDLFGRRRIFVLGMLGFTVTSAACSVAADQGELVAARLAQGLAAAMMLPQVLAVISASTDAAARPRAMAWYGVAAGAGSIAGQVFGGLLVTADIAGLGWRLIFLVNVPIGVIGALLARRVVPESGRDAGRPALDPLGAVGMAAGLALALVPLTLGRTTGWAWWTWLSMSASVPVLAATLYWQRVLRLRGGNPLLDLSLFRIPSFRSGFTASFAFMACFASYMFTLALLLQVGLKLDAFSAGLAFAPAGLGYSLTALLAPRLVRRYGKAAISAGAVIAALGLAALGIAAATGADGGTTVAWIVASAAVISLGNGIILPSLISTALRDVPPRHAGAAAGALSTGQQFASAAGVAGIGTLYFATAGAGQGEAMAWAAGADAVLALVVAGLVLPRARRGRGREMAGLARRTLPRPAAYALAAAVIGLCLFASTAPSPLYRSYAELWHFSPLTLTLIFATYAFGVLAALLLTGRISDQVGRRPVLLVALGTLMVSAIAFITADSPPWLFAARGLQGIATGTALSAASAALLDLHPRRDPLRAGLANAVASATGLGAGALVSALLVQSGTAPRSLPYAVELVLVTAALISTCWMPEPVREAAGFRLTIQRPSVPAGTRHAFLLASLATVSSWSVAGLFFSLGAQMSGHLFGTANAITGAIPGILLGFGGALSQLLFHRAAPWRAVAIGSASLTAGMLAIGVATSTGSSAAFLGGAIAAGLGFGASFLGGLRQLVVVIPHEHRAAVLSAFYVVAYAALALPAIAAGAVVTRLGLAATFEMFGVIIAAIASVVAAEAWRTRGGRVPGGS